MGFEFDWVDAFTDVAFGGNGCAVVQDAAHLDASVCKAFVRETSLVECTFVAPSDVADFKVRYFLASREIPFAGHPTVATVAALAARGRITDGDLTLETGAGIVPVTLQDGVVTMTQIAPEFGPQVNADLVAKAVGLTAVDIVATPQIVSTGLPFCITLLKDKDCLRRARIDDAGFAAYSAALGQDGDMMEPFLVALGGETPAGDTFSRLLLTPPSPPEDPFTGSATGAMAAYLWHHGLIDRPEFVAEQGHWMGRPGQAQVQVLGPRDAMTGVKVAGRSYVLMQGTVALPEG